MPNAMCRPALGRPTNLPGFLAGGFSSSSLELSLLLVDGFLFAWAPFGTSFLFLAAGDLRAQGLSEALRGAGRAEGHRVPRALTAASRRRCPGGRPRWGPAPSKAREAALASVHQSVGRSVSQRTPVPLRPGPSRPSPLTAAASLAKARAAPWQPLSRRNASTRGNRSLGTGRRSAMMPTPTRAARARANACVLT